MRSLARLGFVLLAVHGLLASGRSLVEILADARAFGVDEPHAYLAQALGTWVALGFAPPVALLVLSGRLASLVFGRDRSEPEAPSPEAVLTAGTAVTGLYCGVAGFAGLLAACLFAALTFSRDEARAAEWLASATSSLIFALLGAGLFFFARPLVRWLSSRWRAA